jgi:PAS domain S-box-containing protein
MADSASTQVRHRELDRLELATIELRWFAILLTLATLGLAGRLTPLIIALAALSSAYNVARTLSYARHWHFLGGQRTIVASDLLLIATLMVVLGGEPQFLYALLLLPLISIVSWFGLKRALAVHALNLTFIAINSVVFGTLEPAGLSFLFFAGLFSVAVIYQVAKISNSDQRARREVEALADELSRDKARLTALIDGIGDGLLVVDQSREVIFYNLAASALLGHPEENLRAIPLGRLLPVRLGIEQVDPVRTTLQTGAREQRDDLVVDLSGREVRLYTSVAPILAPNGDIEGAIILFRDITREKAQEEEQTAFASIAAHELRTPVTVIEGYLSHLLSSKGKFQYDEATHTHLERTHESVLHLTALIGDILQVTRAETGKVDLELSDTDLGGLVEQAVSLVREAAEHKGLRLEVELPARPPTISTDPGKVGEVLGNYLDNAIKFTDRGRVTVRLKSEKERVRIEVSDEGLGLSPVDQRRIWQKFYRAENWQTRRTSGTGLGLFICKRLIELLGGEVGVTSELGKGSTFYFTLPKAKARPSSRPPRRAHSEAGAA